MAEISLQQNHGITGESPRLNHFVDADSNYKSEINFNINKYIQSECNVDSHEVARFERMLEAQDEKSSESSDEQTAKRQATVSCESMIDLQMLSPQLLSLALPADVANTHGSNSGIAQSGISSASTTLSCTSLNTFTQIGVSPNSSALSTQLGKAISTMPLGQQTLSLLLPGNLPVHVSFAYQAHALKGLTLKSDDSRMQAWLHGHKGQISRDLNKVLGFELNLGISSNGAEQSAHHLSFQERG